MPVWLHFVPWHWLLWLSVPFAVLACGWYFAAATTMSLLRKVPVTGWLLAGVLIVGVIYHVASVSSAASGAAKAQAAKDSQALAQASQAAGTCASALDDVNAKAANDKAAAEARMKLAAKLIQQLGQSAVQAQTDLADARQKLANAARSPNCATTASLELCSAMSNY